MTFQSTTGTATIAVTDGKHEIAAPVELANRLDVSGSISGTGPLTMSGTNGTLILSGTGLYTGGTIVNAGILAVTTSTAIPDNQSLTVGAGGTLIFDPSYSAGTIQGMSLAASPVTARASKVIGLGMNVPFPGE